MRNVLVGLLGLMLLAGAVGAVNYTYVLPVNHTISSMTVGKNFTTTLYVYSNTTNDSFINLTLTESGTNWTHCWANTTGWGFNNNHTNHSVEIKCMLFYGESARTVVWTGYSSEAQNLTATWILSPIAHTTDRSLANTQAQRSGTAAATVAAGEQAAKQELPIPIIGGFIIILLAGAGLYVLSQKKGKKR